MTPARGSHQAGTSTLTLRRVVAVVSMMFVANALDIGGLPAEHPSQRAETFLIDLPTALRLAERENPTIAIAREAIAENLAIQRQARALLLPTLSAGTNLHLHRGNLQPDEGQMLGLAAQSLYFGGGARALGGGTVDTPAVRIFGHLGDALFEPLVARQLVAASQFDARATSNAVLLEVATRYLELKSAEARLDAIRQSESEAFQVVRITDAFANTGQGRKSDADRAQGRALLIRNEVQRAQERLAVASSQLARVLRLDPAIQLTTPPGPIEALQLVDPSYELEPLIRLALRGRPELAARSQDVAAAQARHRQEQMRPLLPTISVGVSGGVFGGGSNLTPPTFDSFGGRADFDVWAVWTLQNVGLGNRALQGRRRAQIDQAVAQLGLAINQVRREVSDAYGVSAARWRQMDVAQRQLGTAQAGFREELDRIRGGQGLPIEVLNSLELLATARQDVILALTEYDQAQFRLFVALGDPPTVAFPLGGPLSAGPVP